MAMMTMSTFYCCAVLALDTLTLALDISCKDGYGPDFSRFHPSVAFEFSVDA